MKKLPVILCTILGIIILSYQPPQRSMAATPQPTIRQSTTLDADCIKLIKTYDMMKSNEIEINRLLKEKPNENTSNNTSN